MEGQLCAWEAYLHALVKRCRGYRIDLRLLVLSPALGAELD
jgi:hypothetical protein